MRFENIFSQVVNDTLYSEPALDGELAYFYKYNQVVINAGEGSTLLGDGISAVGYGNISSRGFLSFSLTDLKNNISIDSAKLVVYEMGSFGNSKYDLFPIWDVPRGDTLFCIVDHVDFGESLDTLDWYLDSLDKILERKIGIIFKDSIKGFKELDVTKYVREDMINKRLKSQFQIRFEIDTDNDDFDDAIQFSTPNKVSTLYSPKIIIQYHLTTINNDLNLKNIGNRFFLFQNYPNPFNSNTVISFEVKEDENTVIELFNNIGQEVRTVLNQNLTKGFYSKNLSFESLPSGLYFLKMNTRSYSKTISLIYLK